MVTIDLLHALTEEQDRITINNCKDLHDYILVQKQCREFKLIFENGKRLSNSKISKIDQIIEKDFKDKKEIKVLLTTKHYSNLKNLEEVIFKKDFSEALNKVSLNYEISEKIKLWYDTLYQIKTDTQVVETQKSILKILENFYHHTIFKQENRLQKLIDRKCKYLEENSVLEKELDSVLNNLKQESKLNQILNDLIDIDAISKQFPKFQKMCDNYTRKIETVNESKSLVKLKDNISQICKDQLDNNQSRNNNELNNLEKLENIKKLKDYRQINLICSEILKLNYIDFKNKLEELSKIRKNNSSKIKNLLTDKCVTLKTEISKIDELELIEKSLNKDLDIFQIPKILPEEIKEMQTEVIKRKEYEYYCDYYRKYYMENIVSREEERRKEFKEKKQKYIKNALYKSIFENLVERCEMDKKEEFINKFPNLEDVCEKLKLQVKHDLYNDNKIYNEYYLKLNEINNELTNYLKDKYKLITNSAIPETGDKIDSILNNILDSINKMKDASVSISAPNFDLSNLTINQSIYESQIKKDEEKNKYIDANAHEGKVTEGINNFISIHKYKIYFYDKFYDYLVGYATKFKINHNLNPENPETIGIFVEKILSDHIKLLRERSKIIPRRKDK